MNTEQERAAFDAWAEGFGLPPTSLNTVEPWAAWKARAALAATPAPVEPVAWGMRDKTTGLILDVICPDEHESFEGDYTVPLFAAPVAATPAPAEPHVWLYDFMDGATLVRNWATTNKAEAFAPGNFNQRGYVPAEN